VQAGASLQWFYVECNEQFLSKKLEVESRCWRLDSRYWMFVELFNC
jgi:hypothetical protein